MKSVYEEAEVTSMDIVYTNNNSKKWDGKKESVDVCDVRKLGEMTECGEEMVELDYVSKGKHKLWTAYIPKPVVPKSKKSQPDKGMHTCTYA